jgi:hypothetical protein
MLQVGLVFGAVFAVLTGYTYWQEWRDRDCTKELGDGSELFTPSYDRISRLVQVEIVKTYLCHIDEEGRLVLPEEVADVLKSKGIQAAILSCGSDAFRLEFFPDSDTATAFMAALEDMDNHREVYEALAKS